MKLLSSLLITLLFVAFATGQSVTDDRLTADTLEKESDSVAPTFSWEIPSLNYVLAADSDIPYLNTPKPTAEEPIVQKKEELEVSNDIGAVSQEHELLEEKDINEDAMQNFGETSEGLKGHELKLKLKLRLKDSHGEEEEEEEDEEEESGEEESEGEEVGEGLEKSKGKMKSKKSKYTKEKSLKYKPLKVNPFTESIKEEEVTRDRLRISPWTLRSPRSPYYRSRLSDSPVRRRFMSEPYKKPFGETGKPSLEVLYAKLTITHNMLKALEDYMGNLENEKLVEATRSNPQLSKRLQLLSELTRRLHSFMLEKIEKMNSEIESLKMESSGERLGLGSRPMGVRRGVEGIQGVRGITGVQGIESIRGEQNRLI